MSRSNLPNGNVCGKGTDRILMHPGGYMVDETGKRLEGIKYNKQLTYYVRDYYDWDLDSKKGFGPIGDADLAAMHRYGVARAYPVYGEGSYKVTWPEGHPEQVTVEKMQATNNGRQN